MEYDSRFSVAQFQWYSEMPLTEANGNQNTCTFLKKRYNAVLSIPNNSCTSAVDTKSFPAPVSNIVFLK